ncbi:MAG TPA: aconitase family protein [Polyangiaceae bacterium]|jgi:aconitate hydratase
MVQKILTARTKEQAYAPAAGETMDVSVDQIVLARAPARAFGEALRVGLKKTPAEVAVAYDGLCVTGAAPRRSAGGDGASPIGEEPASEDARAATIGEMPSHGVLIARAGVGFPGPVHLERFASPARLCVTDEPRIAGVGGIGMLTLVVPTPLLARALAQGSVAVRAPVSVQVLLSGRLRPFVCARDVALELLRRGVAEAVRRAEETLGAPVVLEFAGPSVRALSVGERSVLAALAPQVGAAGGLFVSDERTEVFLRDQRRSKAHRALAPDAGAPCEDVINLDLGAVDPLVLDELAQVRAVRDLAGRPVTQVILGGDGGTTLRDLLAVAALLKSKRVPPRLDFLVAVPSRQMLEVLAGTGALTDLIATGARLVEPDARIASGALYPAPSHGVAMRTCDPEPRVAGQRGAVVGSAETLAYAVATGQVGDPRAFRRPVRVTVPRALPTDDVLVARKGDAARAPASPASAAGRHGSTATWRAAQTLELLEGAELAGALPMAANGSGGVAVVCSTLDEVRDLAVRAPEVSSAVRAVLAPYIPSGLVALLSAAGIAAIRLDAAAAKRLKGQKTIALPAPAQWAERQPTTVSAGAAELPLTWLATGTERAWATGATKPAPSRTAR